MPRFETSSSLQCYTVDNLVVTANAGAYGAWLGWDPELWISYEKMVETVSLVATFSLSMPIENSGTYFWLLPQDTSRAEAVFCRLPKRSIPTTVWILALLTNMSTIPKERRSTWYLYTDFVNNITGITLHWIRAAIQRPAPVEQYGTY